MSSSNDLQQQLESNSNLIRLIGLICEQYQLDPSIKTNIINIKSFLGPLRVDVIVSQTSSLDDANALIVKLYGDTMAANTSSVPDNMNTTKDFLLQLINTPGDDAANIGSDYKDTFTNKRERFKESLTGAGSILDLSSTDRIETIKYLNYQSLFRDEYIIIDSRYQNKANGDSTKMVFALLGDTKTKSDNGGVIIGSRVKDIVEIEVYPFSIPYKPVYATFYNKITLSINEWVSSSSFEAYEGGQFHFSFDIDRIENNLIYLTPINKVYSFSRPVNHVDDCSLSFGAMLPKISFDPDRMFPSFIDYSNQYGLIKFSQPHGLVTGDLVYITNFNTPEPARDVVVINEVNRAEGHTIVKKDNYSFIINVDLTAVYHEEPAGSGNYPITSFVQPALVYFASKRVQIQMRLRYLTSYT